MFQPNQIADDLKKNGGYIPGVRPGKPTAEFLDFTMTRLTFAGAICSSLIVVSHPAAFCCRKGLNVPYNHGAILRRHEFAHHRGRDSRHDAAGGNAPASSGITTASCARAGSNSRPWLRQFARHQSRASRRKQGTLMVLLCVWRGAVGHRRAWLSFSQSVKR